MFGRLRDGALSERLEAPPGTGIKWTYHLIILGEAANNVSDECCKRHAEVDFRDMAGLRHKLVHDYANIDMGRIWQVLVDDVPAW